MARQFEYLVCFVQQARVTFVNGNFEGRVPLDPNKSAQMFESCPTVYEYLQMAGAAGWELVAATASVSSQSSDHYERLYLKRERE